MESVRAFIAIPIPSVLQRQLAAVQDRLRSTGADVRWTRPTSIHLTLAFLGPLPVEQIRSVADMMDQQFSNISPFHLQLSGIGTFGRPGRPRVIWAGIAPAPELSGLHEALIEGLRDLGQLRERRPFHPHLTLGRVRSVRRTGALTDTLTALKTPALNPLPVTAVTLYESRTERTGAVHLPLHCMELKDSR